MEKEQSSAITAKQAIELAIETGESMLANGAETSRAEDTMRRLIKKCGYSAELFVTSTDIFACINDGTEEAVTLVKGVKKRSSNLDKVVKINNLSRSFTEGRTEFNEMSAAIKDINSAPPPHRFMFSVFASGIASSCFTFMLGAGFFDSLNAMIAGILCQLIISKISNTSRVLVNTFYGASCAAVTIILTTLGVGESIDKTIIGAVMPMLPGISFTNAIRDIIEGDYLSGVSRMLEASLIAIALAAGVGTVLQFWLRIFGGVL